ncbi:PAS domain-containing protein [Streptomyces mirabilis]|nr:PAS domain-containing protein [Streptomyces mirabilis]
MTNTDHTPRLAELVSPREIPDAAIAMLDAEGTVVGWTHAAEQLVGYSAAQVVGRSAAHVLPPAKSALSATAFAEQCRAHDGWSGTVTIRHRDGHAIKMTLRISRLWGQDAGTRWLVSVTDIGTLSSGASNGAVRESLLAHAPVGIAVYDPQLRCTWVSDVMERHDGTPRERRFGRRLRDSLPAVEAEALEVVMRQVLESGTTMVHEYRTWSSTDRRREHAFSASFFCLQDADGTALSVCAMSVDVTGNRRARERLAILSEAGTRIGSTLEVMQTGQELADLAVPLLADHAVVDLMESVPFGGIPGRGPARRTAAHLCCAVPGWPPSIWVSWG